MSIAQVMTLMSIYSVLCLLLEYPTGVIGDVFGYKLSITLGNVLGFISMVMMAQSGSYHWYLLALLILAFANTFQSGSDVGMLKHLTADIKKSSGDYKYMSDMVLFFSAICGGTLASFNYQLALYINAVVWLMGGILIQLVPLSQSRENGNNVFATAYEGIAYTLRSKPLMGMMLITTLLYGFGLNIKSLFGSFSEVFSLSVNQIGYLVGAGIFIRAVGAKLAHKFNYDLLVVGFGIASLVFVSSVGKLGITTICFFIVQLLIGYFIAKSDAETHELAIDRYRASVFSLRKLSARLFNSAHLWLIGYFLTINSFSSLMQVTGAVIVIGLISYYWLIKSDKSNNILGKINQALVWSKREK
jgi:MFS family permease